MFTDQKTFIATENDCRASWSGGKNGKYFRCGYCGHKFSVGDKVRWIYTNDTPGAAGNPFACEKCDDGDNESMRLKWKEKCKLYDKDGAGWYFLRD